MGRPDQNISGAAGRLSAPALVCSSATAATVTLVQRRAVDLVCGDVIPLPDEVYLPIAACRPERRTFIWRGA